jgi:2-methylcitrate dehydratase
MAKSRATRADEATTVGLLARAITAIGDEHDVGSAQIERARLLLLDTLGCGIGGWVEAPAQAAVRAVSRLGGAPQVQVIGTTLRTSAPNAVLANGTLCRVLDLNDYLLGTEAGGSVGGHPSDSIAVALAFAEAEHRSGRALLTAIVLAYEIYGRVRQFLGDDKDWDGTSGTGIVAPATAGWLARLDEVRLAHALALSIARCATSAMVRIGDLSAAKSMANAMIAQTGAIAVALASEGLTGPLAVLDHPKGMHAVFPNSDIKAQLVAPLTAMRFIMQANIKPYPCLSMGQGIVCAAIAMRDKLGGDVARIAQAHLVVADRANIRKQIGDPGRTDPKSKEAADHSFPFLAAVALIDGELGAGQFEHERWNDPTVRALMGRLRISTDAAYAREREISYPCRLEVTETDGQRHTVEVERAPGYARFGIDAGMVVQKFRTTTAPFLDRPDQERLIEAVLDIDRAPDLGRLTAAMAQPVRSTPSLTRVRE